MKTKLFALFMIVALCFTFIACKEEPATPEAPLELEVGEGCKYTTLKAAVDAVPAGKTANITIQSNETLTAQIVIANKTINLIAGDNNVVLTDGLTAATYSGGNYAALFEVYGTGKLTLSGSADEKTLTFYGAGSGASYKRRIMFNVASQAEHPDDTSAEMVINDGVVITNVYSTYTGAILRGYGKFTINGGTFTANTATVNGVVGNIYGPITINGGTFSNNTQAGASTKGGVFNMPNSEIGVLTINGGTFTGNTGGTQGCVVQAFDSAGGVYINGGTFTNNTGTGSTGAIIYVLGAGSITGGTFSGNTPCDIKHSSSCVVDAKLKLAADVEAM